MTDKKNPYANADGSPIDGKEPEFFDWESKKDKDRLEALPNQEKEKELKAQRDLNDRMQP
jgi:hypothetical protein